MARISRFGLAKLRLLVPPEMWSMIEGEVDAAHVPTGDRGVSGERHDQLIHGGFRSRYEHLVRYREVADQDLGLVIDLGCGTGYGSALLSARSQVVGVDSSVGAVTYAKNAFRSVDFVLGSAEFVPASDGSIDAVVAFEVIEHLNRPEQLLTECRRVLKKGGKLLLSTPNPRHLGNVWQNRLLGRPIPAKVDLTNPYHLREFAYQEMRELLESEGFEVVSARGQTIPIDWCVPLLGRLHRALQKAAGLSDVYEWFISIIGSRFPSMSWTVLYSAVRR